MIKVENLVKRFDDVVAVNNVSCEINDGCIYGLVGSNGAGKSTFLRLLSGVYRGDGGSITVDGQPVYENPYVKKDIVFVADELYFLPQSNMNAMAKMYAACYSNFDVNRFKTLCKEFNLNPKKNLNTFSKGMRRQAATVLALSARPKYLFLDETFDGLDPIIRNLVKRTIYEDVLERRTTVILASHSLRELEDTCDQLALLHKGGIVLESDIQNLKTAMFKVQAAFSDTFDRSRFENIDVASYSQKGSVANLIVRGNKEEVEQKLASLNPLLIDILPLSLEEVFVYEMDALGYSFDTPNED